MKNRNKRFTSVLAASMALGMMAPAMVSVAPVMAYNGTVPGVYQPQNGDIVRTVGNFQYLITQPKTDASGVVGVYAWEAELISIDNKAIDYSSLAIPSTITVDINGNTEIVPVTAIGPAVFKGVNTLHTLNIGKNITEIGEAAFMDTSLVNVIVNGTGVNIKALAFHDNDDLVSVTLNGVNSIGNRAFSECADLSKVTLSDGLTTIGDAAFHDDPALTTITLPDSVTTIGAKTFVGTNLTGSIHLPNSLTSIGSITNGIGAASEAGSTFGTNAGSLRLYLPEGDGAINWTPNVFGFPYSGNANETENFQIVGVGETAPGYLGIDQPFYVGTPYLNMSSKNASGSSIYADNQNMQIVLGNNVNIYTFVPGTLKITGPDGKVTTKVYNVVASNDKTLPADVATTTVDKEGFKNKTNTKDYNTYVLNTPQVGVTTIEFTALKGKIASENTITVVPNGNNAWIEAKFEVPTNWTVGSEDRPSGAVAKYGEVEYVYSTTKVGGYTDQVPTTPGWYWVMAIVNPAADGSYNGLDTDPVQFEMFPAGEFGGWVKSGNNWMYYNEDGEAVKDTMMEIDGDLYMFDANGIMQTGWKNTDAGWMFFDNAGHAKSGWLYDHEDDVWYYFDADHIMAKSTWVEDAGKQYYLTSSGAMAASRWLTKDGHDVYVDNSGALKTGWLAYNMNWYYLEPSTGYMATSGTVDGWNIQSNGIAVKA